MYMSPKIKQNESLEEKQNRLAANRVRDQNRRDKQRVTVDNFVSFLNVCLDVPCAICLKLLYLRQRYTLIVSKLLPHVRDYLPQELQMSERLVLCYRHHKHLTTGKIDYPSQAYWNNLDLGVIPREFLVLTDTEKRLLSRLFLNIKVHKIPGRWGQHECSGQAFFCFCEMFQRFRNS